MILGHMTFGDHLARINFFKITNVGHGTEHVYVLGLC